MSPKNIVASIYREIKYAVKLYFQPAFWFAKLAKENIIWIILPGCVLISILSGIWWFFLLVNIRDKLSEINSNLKDLHLRQEILRNIKDKEILDEIKLNRPNQ